MPDTATGNGHSNYTLTLSQVDSYIANVAGGFKSVITRRKEAGFKALGEHRLPFDNRNHDLEEWVAAYDYLREHLRSTFGEGA